MGKSEWWMGLGLILGLGLTEIAVGVEPNQQEVDEVIDRYGNNPTASEPVPKSSPKPVRKVNSDRKAWKSAEKCGTAACFKDYLTRYPKGRYAQMARERLKPKVTGQAAGSIASPTIPPVSGPELVHIPGGCFQMGSPKSKAGRNDDERQHRVCVKAFEIGKYEVTVGEFRQFVGATNYRTDAERNVRNVKGCAIWNVSAWEIKADTSWRNPPGFKQTDMHPVVCVSWNDAVAYTDWLSRETGQRYRLPTEVEWEYAARAGTKSARYWGDDPNQACRYENVADQTGQQTFPKWTIHSCADGHVYTAPVGSFRANTWQLHDMLGNVQELTCSLYDGQYDITETKCPDNNAFVRRALRGGQWATTPVGVRSATRWWWGNPDHRNSNLGFRLVKSL